jgi:hypothetical protein
MSHVGYRHIICAISFTFCQKDKVRKFETPSFKKFAKDFSGSKWQRQFKTQVSLALEPAFSMI